MISWKRRQGRYISSSAIGITRGCVASTIIIEGLPVDALLQRLCVPPSNKATWDRENSPVQKANIVCLYRPKQELALRDLHFEVELIAGSALLGRSFRCLCWSIIVIRSSSLKVSVSQWSESIKVGLYTIALTQGCYLKDLCEWSYSYIALAPVYHYKSPGPAPHSSAAASKSPETI